MSTRTSMTIIEVKQTALYQSLSLARDCWLRMERLDTRRVIPAFDHLKEKIAYDAHKRAAARQARELREIAGAAAFDSVLTDMLIFEGLL